MIEKGKRVAAMLLQAGEGDIDYRDGKFGVRGSAREVSLFEVAERAAELARTGVIPDSLDTQAISSRRRRFLTAATSPRSKSIPRPARSTIVNYVAVGDCGNVLDETIVEGQVHGGVAQGLGQALTENTIYDAGGQLVSGSFMDYAMPRAGSDAGHDGRASRGRLPHQSARRQGHRRGRHHRGARRR